MAIDATVLEERRPIREPEKAILDGTKPINRREDLFGLQQGDSITVYDGNNYGKLMLERQRLTYVGVSGEEMLFKSQNQSITRIQFSKGEIVSREGVVVLSKENGVYKF